MLKQLMEARKFVESVLSENPDTRNDDKELILRVWEAQGLYLSPEQEKMFKKCYSTETIRRTRQKLQEEGLYPPTERVKFRRLKADVEMRNAISSQKAGIGHYCFDSKREMGVWSDIPRLSCKNCMPDKSQVNSIQRQENFL